MLETIRRELMGKGARVDRYPDVPYRPYDGFMGMPVLDVSKCSLDKACEEACPTDAIKISIGRLSIDMGLCIFCGECARACPHKAIAMSKEFELASKRREGLVRTYVIRQ